MALSFDVASNGGTGNSPLSWSHTVAGSGDILLVGGVSSVQTVTATYNNVSMTQIGSSLSSGGNWMFLFILLAPATGTNTVTVTSTSATLWGVAASYISSKQSGQPDANNTGSSLQAGDHPMTLTTVADNCWIAGVAYNESNAQIAAGTATALRVTNSGYAGIGWFDSNGAFTPAGSHTINSNSTTSDTVNSVYASIAPAAANVLWAASLF